jgi:uncharacterized protein (DUF433 family)
MKKRTIGRFIVVDSAVNNGAPTFQGTVVPVTEVLNEVARETPWDVIVARREGLVSRDAIAEAVRLAGELLVKHRRVPPKRELDAPPTVLGEYVVADPAICHGSVTFRGTRIFVEDVLNGVARGEPWDYVIENWYNSVTRESIAEAIRLASEALSNHAHDYAMEFASL